MFKEDRVPFHSLITITYWLNKIWYPIQRTHTTTLCAKWQTHKYTHSFTCAPMCVLVFIYGSILWENVFNPRHLQVNFTGTKKELVTGTSVLPRSTSRSTSYSCHPYSGHRLCSFTMLTFMKEHVIKREENRTDKYKNKQNKNKTNKQTKQQKKAYGTI